MAFSFPIARCELMAGHRIARGYGNGAPSPPCAYLNLGEFGYFLAALARRVCLLPPFVLGMRRGVALMVGIFAAVIFLDGALQCFGVILAGVAFLLCVLSSLVNA